jgi:hypothetical protein
MTSDKAVVLLDHDLIKFISQPYIVFVSTVYIAYTNSSLLNWRRIRKLISLTRKLVATCIDLQKAVIKGVSLSNRVHRLFFIFSLSKYGEKRPRLHFGSFRACFNGRLPLMAATPNHPSTNKNSDRHQCHQSPNLDRNNYGGI